MFEYFSTWQCLFFIVVTELLVWDLLTKLLETVKHCATARTFKKAIENEKLDEWKEWVTGKFYEKEEEK